MSHAFTNYPTDVIIESFGYRHGTAPDADITIDLREHLAKPSDDPNFLVSTGHDPEVRDHVMSTPGASGLVDGLTWAVTALVNGTRLHSARPVRVAIGCQGGLNRSVVIAHALADLLKAAKISVETVDLGILQRDQVSTTV